MESDKVNIAGLDKAAVLAALFNAAKPQGFGHAQFDLAPMSEGEARATLATGQTRFDYFEGRSLKIDLAGPQLDTHLFNRDNGAGAAESAILRLRRETDPVYQRISRLRAAAKGRPGFRPS